MPLEPRCERRELGDDAFLTRIALDFARRQQRAIALADRADHEKLNFLPRRIGGSGRHSRPARRQTSAYYSCSGLAPFSAALFGRGRSFGCKNITSKSGTHFSGRNATVVRD